MVSLHCEKSRREFIAALMDEARLFFGVPNDVGMFFVKPSETSKFAGFYNTEQKWLVVYDRPNKSIMTILQTLCHEIIHALQHKEGRLEFVGDAFQFEGKKYPRDYPYFEQPWEVEAFQNQDRYLERFLNHLHMDDLNVIRTDAEMHTILK